MSRVREVLRHDRWATSEGHRDGSPFIIRFRTPVIESGEGGEYSRQLLVVWPYAEEDSGAMLTSTDSDEMAVFENRLCEAWEHDGLAFLAAVLTFDGARQWVFYTRDVSACGKRLAAMPQEEEPYPIELTTEEDADWTYLRERILGVLDWQDQQLEWKQALQAKG